MIIDHNFMKVLSSGTCYNICDKSFQREPKMKGIPRAFIKYNYKDISVPYPLHL